MSRSLSQPVISLAFIFCLCASAAVALAQQGQQRQESNLVEMAMVARNVAQLTETNASEVELALDAVGTGSAEEMTGRIFANRFTVLDAEFRRRAVATLPDRIRSSRITEGQLLRRVEAVIKPVLEFHGRSDKVELFLYQGKQPLGML